MLRELIPSSSNHRQYVKSHLSWSSTLKGHDLTPEQLAATDRVILEREYELLYLQGRVDEMVKPPYDKIHRSMGRGRILSTQVKRMFPHLHRIYRKHRGYED